MKDSSFKISIVMAVYNVELFLGEAIESVIEQDIGFEENIQLILVDDGALDASGSICDDYAERYPNNITVIHKPNGGVSSARNMGIPLIQGKYVSFMDSDDKLESNVCSAVYKFFEDSEEKTDVAAIPIIWFEGKTGPHILNYKFNDGSRVINLCTEYKALQLSSASAFIRTSVLQKNNLRFDEGLKYTEDAKLITLILCEKMTLGVVSDTTYWCRRRVQGEQSATQKSVEDKDWWTKTLQKFQGETSAACKEKLGYVPTFAQYLFMYDLQWRMQQRYVEEDVLTAEEFEEYIQELKKVLVDIDDRIIMEQSEIYGEQKKLLMEFKYGTEAIQYNKENGMLHCKNTMLSLIEWNGALLDFMQLKKDELVLEGYHVWLEYPYENLTPAVKCNGELILCESIERERLEDLSLNQRIVDGKGFRISIPLSQETEQLEIEFGCVINGVWIKKLNVHCGRHFPLSKTYENAYYCANQWMAQMEDEKLIVKPCTRKEKIKAELRFDRELWHSDRRKIALCRLLYHCTKGMLRKEIWLVSDRVNKADDNGEVFYKYLLENQKKKVNAYFVLGTDCEDYARLSKGKKLVPFESNLQKMLYLYASCLVSSQAEENFEHPYKDRQDAVRDIAADKRFVFLQHGITKDDVSAWLNRYNKNISTFVVATRMEYQSILDYQYHYTPNEVALTGFPRFDRLHDDKQRMITIMPTWRKYLLKGIDPKTGIWEMKDGFKESFYYKMYHELINDQRLFDAAEKFGYKIRFLNHPNMTAAANLMTGNEHLIQVPLTESYCDIFAQSSMIVTDYSSTAFDFAYLRKPVLYYQADNEEFFGGAHTYEKGYFDYERDGFGEVEYSLDAVVNRLIEYMERDCALKEKYKERIDATFPYADQKNCERVFNAIYNKQQEKENDIYDGNTAALGVMEG